MLALFKDTSPDARHECILHYFYLVESVASRLVRRLPSHVEKSEMIGVGVIGLIEAVDRFDPDKGVPFHAYAELRIRGSMIDALRQQDWVPRSVRRRSDALEDVRGRLQRRFGRLPSHREIAAELGMSEKGFSSYMRDCKIRKLVSLNAPVGGEGIALVDLVMADAPLVDDALCSQELQSIACKEVASLPDRERTAVEMYYFQGCTLKQIGDCLGVTESRACQLRSAAIRRLRKRLAWRLAR